MTIVDKIINSIHAVLDWDETVTDTNGVQTTVHHTFPVYYHDDPTLNLMTQTMEFPCALLILLTRGRVPNIGGQLKEQVSAAVFFVEAQEGIDFDAVQNEVVIDRCKQRALSWLMSLPSSTDVEIVAEAQSARIYDKYDDILTGYGVNVDLREVVGFACPEQ